MRVFHAIALLLGNSAKRDILAGVEASFLRTESDGLGFLQASVVQGRALSVKGAPLPPDGGLAGTFLPRGIDEDLLPGATLVSLPS